MEQPNKQKGKIVVSAILEIKTGQSPSKRPDENGEFPMRPWTKIKLEASNGTKFTTFDKDFIDLIGKEVNILAWEKEYEYTDKRTGETKIGHGWNCELDKGNNDFATNPAPMPSPKQQDDVLIMLGTILTEIKEIKERIGTLENEALNNKF